MKRSLFFILILLFLGCESNQKKIQKTWISNYAIHPRDFGEEIIGYTPSKIYKFRNDSLFINSINYQFPSNSSHSYKFSDHEIILNDSIKLPIPIVTNDSLILFMRKEYGDKLIFKPLTHFNQALRKDELYKLLTNHTFFNQMDSTKIEFRENKLFTLDQLDIIFRSKSFWELETFESELFLVLDDSYIANTIQITKFNSEEIKGIIHGFEDKEITFQKINLEKIYQRSDLLGEWTRITNNPLSQNSNEIALEHLIISDSTIIRNYNSQIDTISWELNRENDIIILDVSAYLWDPSQWNISSFKNNTLTIERNKITDDFHNLTRDTISFKRVK